jgi:glycine/D-amino acid oxidase-like deaminating enzyme
VRVQAAPSSSSSDKEEVLPADVVVIAMGPWSGAAREWLPLPPFSGQKYHSILLQPPEGAQVTADCVFTGYKMASGR